MSRTIETTLTADSSQLRAEYAKAAKATEVYESRVQAAQALARSQTGDNLRALQLEAQGRKEAAEAVRQQMLVAEQARQLAASTGMTEQAALETVRYRVQLEQQIAQQKQATLQASQRELQLEQQKAAAAADVAKQRRAQDDANAASVRAQIDAQQARQTRIKNLPSQGWQALPGGLPALTPQSLAQMERATMLQRNMRREMLGMGMAGRSAGMGLLAVSQGVEDAQYGIRGILNNIPQAVMAFGGSAGLAGALSLTAVGAVLAYDAIKKLTGEAAMEAWAKRGATALEAYGEAIQRAAEANRTVVRDEETRLRLVSELAKEQGMLSRAIERDESAKDQADAATDAMGRWLDRVGQILKAQQALRTASQVKAGPEQSQQTERNELGENQRLRALQLAYERDDAQKRLNAAGREYERIWEGIGESVTRYQRKLGEVGADLEPAQKRLRELSAGLQYAEEQLKNARENQGGTGIERNAQKNRDGLQKQVDAVKLVISAREAEKRQLEELMRQAESTGDASKKALSEEIRGLREKMAAYDEQRTHVEDLSKLEREALAAKQQAEMAEQARSRKDFEDETAVHAARAAGNERLAKQLERQRAIEGLKARLMREQGVSASEALEMARKRVDLENRAASAAERAARQGAKRDFAGELQVLRLQAAGQERAARALQEELEVRASAREMAQSMGIREQDALRLARERMALQEKVESRERMGHRRRSTIYTLSAEESAERKRERAFSFSTRNTGIGNSARDREQKAQRLTTREKDSAASYYDRSLAAQEELVKILKGVGSV